MPDHCHILLKGDSKDCNLLYIMNRFKQKSGYWLSKNFPDIRWHKNYYDQILRDKRELIRQMNYILNNPVRKKLVSNWREYPYKDSTLYKI